MLFQLNFKQTSALYEIMEEHAYGIEPPKDLYAHHTYEFADGRAFLYCSVIRGEDIVIKMLKGYVDLETMSYFDLEVDSTLSHQLGCLESKKSTSPLASVRDRIPDTRVPIKPLEQDLRFIQGEDLDDENEISVGDIDDAS